MLTESDGRGAVDILWIPLGAGDHVVRLSGKIFEATSALLRRRARCDLYHSALEVHAPEGRYVVEQTPVPAGDAELRGVVRQGAVGLKSAARFRVFRYEIRCWLDGAIPDAHEAVGGPVRLSEDLDIARRVLEAAHAVPTPVWGRDELRTGDMWNSNSVIAWLLCRSGLDVASINPPAQGRAPGWDAGIVVATRDRPLLARSQCLDDRRKR
jgi:hypothetical protein